MDNFWRLYEMQVFQNDEKNTDEYNIDIKKLKYYGYFLTQTIFGKFKIISYYDYFINSREYVLVIDIKQTFPLEFFENIPDIPKTTY